MGCLLDGPRARDAFLLRCVMDPPWSLRVEDRAPVSIIAMVSGDAWIVGDDGSQSRLGPGAIGIVRGPDPYTFADDPATPPQVVIHPGQRCTTPDGTELAQPMGLGVRSWGNAADGSTTMLVGTYETSGEVSRRLLEALPPVVVLADEHSIEPLVALLSKEIGRDEPGQQTVLDRLVDLLLIASLRAWLSRAESGAPTWYLAHDDPVVGPALRMLQHNPGHPWTVASLAAEVGVSRALLARRFTDLVGEPPMTFLTSWRLSLAADLLAEEGATVGSVAHQVGYGSAFALSTAFKRVRGISPAQHRRRLREAS